MTKNFAVSIIDFHSNEMTIDKSFILRLKSIRLLNHARKEMPGREPMLASLNTLIGSCLFRMMLKQPMKSSLPWLYDVCSS